MTGASRPHPDHRRTDRAVAETDRPARPGRSPAGAGPGRNADQIDHQADAWLVGKAQLGSIEAYEVLIRRHRDRIHRIALRMLGNRDDAEDITQDVVIQVWTALAGFAGDSMFTTWLYRIVVNRCITHLKRRRHDTPLEDPDLVRSPGADAQAEARDRLRAALAALAGLPADQRAPIVLIDIEQLSYDEAASILGVSEPTVRGRLSRGRRQLAETMREWT
ncbi:MAG: RNA polymerase sigma factor [Actinomycetota bacterium]|jgi:RNA polymerase sigma-70 factor (ECF subfamily)|uniref:RNA polymerase sigma factor n=1 Tax=Pseudonocardia TaxID=1847 RepID=UPI00307F8B4C